jgi:hypothetical protein
VCGGGWLRWGSVSGREEAPGRRVHDQDRLSDRELPRACLPVWRRCVHLDPSLPPPACEPADGQPAPSVRMRSTPIAATTMTNTASKFARLGSSRSSPVAASNMIPGWACTAGSLSRVSPTALVPPAPHPMGNPRRHPRSLPPLRLRHHLLATPPQQSQTVRSSKAAPGEEPAGEATLMSWAGIRSSCCRG